MWCQINDLSQQHVVVLLEHICLLLKVAAGAPQHEKPRSCFPVELNQIGIAHAGFLASAVDSFDQPMHKLEVHFEHELVVLTKAPHNPHEELQIVLFSDECVHISVESVNLQPKV